jgi:hypothetical protein
LLTSISGYGFVLNLSIVLCLEYTYLKRDSIVAETFNRSGSKLWIAYSYEVYNMIGLKHYLHIPYQKNAMKAVNQYLKDSIESFDD